MGAWEAFRNVSFLDFLEWFFRRVLPCFLLCILGMYSGCYFQVGNSLRLGMSIPAAYRVALETWASWIENTIDPNKTRVLFRTFEPSHWRYKPKTCYCSAFSLDSSLIEVWWCCCLVIIDHAM